MANNFRIEDVAAAWPLFLLAASLLYRKSKGKPIFYKRPESVRFRQSFASGKSHKNFFTRLGGAHSCLVVQVTGTELDIHPFVPFNWLFLPEIYGLEHRIPLDRVISARIVKKLFWRRVEVEYRTDDGAMGKITLYLKRPEEFLAAIGQAPATPERQPIDQGFVITAKPIEPGK